MKKFLIIFLTFMIVISGFNFALGANIDTQIKNQEKARNDLKKKIQQYNAIAKQKSKQSQTLLSQLTRLKQDANASQNRMEVLEKENGRLQNSMAGLDKNIASVNNEMAGILRVLRGRILDIYKYTPPENSLNLILTSEGPHEALNTAYMLRRFVRQDQFMIDELTEKEKELEKAKSELEANKAQVQKQTDELKKKRAEFNTTIKKTDALLKNVQSEQKKAQTAAQELTNAQRAIGNKINSLMKQKKAAQTRSQPKTIVIPASPAAQNNKSNNKISTPAKTVTPAYSGVAPKTLAWPIQGTITMPYGSRIHPTFKTKIFNSGIDIKAASGTPVKAAGAGEVLYQGWLRGFGQVVIIDHGGDLSTVYAHLSAASVREGSMVKTGTVIGRVGNTGTDSEYGLHFEVRKGGAAQNPMNFLRK